MNKYLLLIVLFLTVSANAQSNFEYQRDWSTYYGPVGGNSNNRILNDSNNKIILSGEVATDYTTYNNTYYGQFRVGNQNNFPVHNTFLYNSIFNDNGTLEYYDLSALSCFENSYIKHFKHIDDAGNKFYIIVDRSTIPIIQPTTNSWYTQNPLPSGLQPAMLAKYAPDGTLIFCTYIPGGNFIKTDDAGNIFLIGATAVANNLTTPGVFQENFLTVYDNSGYQQPNMFISKLDPNGQLLWSTYAPANGTVGAQYFDGNLYIVFANAFQNTQPNIASSGAFESVHSFYGLIKFDANTGNRVWGTFYGPPGTASYTPIQSIAVNANGLFVSGADYIFSNYNSNNYFGTPGSYRPQISGSADIYLSKFSLNGNREWSTYFGSTGYDTNGHAPESLALSDDAVFISGTVAGTHPSIATANVYKQFPDSDPSNNYYFNYYFAKFTNSGALTWCSYYGGASKVQTGMNISVKDKTLYLYGSASPTTGFNTPNCWQPQVENPLNSVNYNYSSFLAKFTDKRALSTIDAPSENDLELSDNPNSGNFRLIGSVLEKENCKITIIDISGKLIFAKEMKKNKTQNFDLQKQLVPGVYIIKVENSFGKKIKDFKMIVKK